MRLRIIILLLFFIQQTSAQKRQSASLANTYLLNEADGVPGFNYMYWQQLPSGKIYAKDFFGAFHTTGNNYTHPVKGTSNLSNGISISPPQTNNDIYLLDQNYIAIIKQDSLWKTVKTAGDKNVYNDNDNKIFSLSIKEKNITVYQFKNEEWVQLAELEKPVGMHLNIDRDIFYMDDRIVLFFSMPNGNLKVYEINTLQLQLKEAGILTSLEYYLFYPNFHKYNHQTDQKILRHFVDFLNKRNARHFTVQQLSQPLLEKYFLYVGYNKFLYRLAQNQFEYLSLDSGNIISKQIIFESRDKINKVTENKYYPYLTVLTGNKPFRVFPYIKKYPKIYDADNSQNIFSLAEDETGRIWAGNYQNKLSIINPFDSSGQVIQLKRQPFAFMNASLFYNNKIYFVGETPDGGILEYHTNGTMKKVLPNLNATGFYLYHSPRGQQLYYPSTSAGYPIYYCDIKELKKPLVEWKKLDSSMGIQPFGMATITEDTAGRIWMGHPKKGFAVYNPATKTGHTFDTRKNETPIGFISSITDKKGTVWMGSDNRGLWYYNDYKKPATPAHIKSISHPLLNTVKRITSMTLMDNWLVLGCYDKVCLLNLDSFYQKNKIIVRYLNPQEAAFTSFTEQNTMLVSKKDSSLWFSTSDMLYQWSIKKWLQLPTYKVKVSSFLEHDSILNALNTETEIKIPANFRGFDILLEYLSPDALPRYTRTALSLNGEPPVYSEPGVQNRFSYKNLRYGFYRFYVQVFEQDGSTSTYLYPFIIDKYIWERWWFWMLLAILLLTPLVLWMNTLRIKAKRDKEISHLSLVTMSNQFRPHFILNTLNAIGADLKDKPDAEKIISSLGESVNIIFKYTKDKKVSHRLWNEWALVQNVIQIHQIIYLPNLKVFIHGAELIEEFKNTELPLGILEVNIENALLHGLRNKKEPPYHLFINITADNNNLYFIIKDYGIGRQASSAISSYKKHGTGIKNLLAIINVLNRFNKDKIIISFADVPVQEGHGTIVSIVLPKKYQFIY